MEFNAYQSERRYVILTVCGNEFVRKVYNRMPIIFPERLNTFNATDRAMKLIIRGRAAAILVIILQFILCVILILFMLTVKRY